MATTRPQKPTQGDASPSSKADAKHTAASKDIWLAGLGAMAQAQAQARAQGSKAFEALVKEGVSLQRNTQSVSISNGLCAIVG